MSRSLAFFILAAALAPPAAAVKPQVPPSQATQSDALRAATDAATRTASNRERDRYRHPYETLTFFGVKPSDTVVEIYPGAGWYTEILAPYLANNGSLALVATDPQLKRMRDKAAAEPKTYQSVVFSPLAAWTDTPAFPAGSADVVLTFRNVHNWHMQGQSADAFKAFYAMLKPGGTLGVVEHRLPESRPDSDMDKSGYMKRSLVVAAAEAAGFKLAGSSEINANPKDTADWPDGVWTLPPSLWLGDKDRAKYIAIGESDRMTLKFVKPAAARAAPERGR